jgi:rhodanese-related sulfurtransferase
MKGILMKTVPPASAYRRILLLVVLSSFAFTAIAQAAGKGDIPRISIEELKSMLDKGTPVTIIDAQPESIYAEGHIKGAISLPWKSQIDLEDVWTLPSDIPIVTYCDCGPGESDSADIAAQLFEMGYEDVKVLQDPAVRGWKEAGYPMEK